MKIKTNNSPKNKVAIIVIVIICVAFLAVLGLYAYQKSKPTNEALYGSGSTKPTKNTPKATSDNSGAIASSKDSPAKNGPDPVVDETVKPRVPTGNFTSHHKPNLSGSPVSNNLSSTCITTPGAWCTIEFTRDGVIKKLPEQQADGNGNVFWNWNLQESGLTAGNWKITAVARNGKLTSSAEDAVPLMVEQ